MNLFLDTNVVIYFLKGIVEAVELVRNAERLAISFITEIELLCYDVKEEEKRNIQKFLDSIEIYYPDPEISISTADIRKKTGLKLPDAIICAQSHKNNFILATADKEILKNKNSIKLINPFEQMEY